MWSDEYPVDELKRLLVLVLVLVLTFVLILVLSVVDINATSW